MVGLERIFQARELDFGDLELAGGVDGCHRAPEPVGHIGGAPVAREHYAQRRVGRAEVDGSGDLVGARIDYRDLVAGRIAGGVTGVGREVVGGVDAAPLSLNLSEKVLGSGGGVRRDR